MIKSKLINLNTRASSAVTSDNSTVVRTKITDASKLDLGKPDAVEKINRLNDAVYTGITGGTPKRITDGSFNNNYLKLGLSDKGLMSAEYWQDMITFNRPLITSMYHGNWIFRRIIDKVSQDMWSSGIVIKGSIEPDAITRVQKRLSRLRSDLIWATAQGRLYGGAASLIMVDDGTDDLSKPLNLNNIKRGTSIQLWSTDRWWGLSTSSEKVTNYKSKDFNTPKYYDFSIDDITTNNIGLSNQNIRVHHSRVLRWVGRKSTRLINTLLSGWGISELEHIYQDLMIHENAKNASGSLIDKTLLEIVKISGLRGVMQGLGLGSEAQEQELSIQMAGLQNFRMNSTVLLDSENDYQQFSASFAGLSELLEIQRDTVAGAAEMPKVLLYGDTKGGLTSDSPAEMEFYAQNINGKQEETLRPVLDKLLPIIFATEGIKITDDFDYDFENIAGTTQDRQMSLLNQTVSSVIQLMDNNIITAETALKEIQQIQKSTGFGSNIDDRDLELTKKVDEATTVQSDGEFAEPEELPTLPDDYAEVKDEIEQSIQKPRRLFDSKNNKE